MEVTDVRMAHNEVRAGTAQIEVGRHLVRVPRVYGFLLILLAGAAINPHDPVAGRVTCSVLVLADVAVLVVSWRAGVEFDATGITVRRYSGRTSRVAWSDVQGFAQVKNGNGANNGVFVAVVLTSGRRLKTQGLAGGSGSRRVRELIAILEAAQARYQPTAPSTRSIAEPREVE
jgi:hypothetical protein